MKRFVVFGWVTLTFALGTWASAAADEPNKGGDKPWYDIFTKKYKNLTSEEERLQKFWHDYYDSVRRYYAQLDGVDWNEYYKNRGYKVSGTGPGCPECQGAKRIPFAPVFVSPSLQWAAPGSPSPDSPQILQKKPK